MTDDLVYFLVILFGILLILSHKWQARAYAKYQNRFYGLHFGQKEIRIGEVLNIIVGILFICFGILSLFKLI
jgi:hypothetical protein